MKKRKPVSKPSPIEVLYETNGPSSPSPHEAIVNILIRTANQIREAQVLARNLTAPTRDKLDHAHALIVEVIKAIDKTNKD